MISAFQNFSFSAFSLLSHCGRFLALAGAEIVQLRAAGAAFLFHFHFRDARRMERKHPLDSFAVGNAADGEGLVHSAAFAADNDAAKNLDPLLVAFRSEEHTSE